MAILSILGLYNYDQTIFEGFDVPEGMERQTALDNILLECGELSLVYTDPAFIKRAIKQWKDKEFNIWVKLYNTENLEYNPIWNVDGTTEEIGTREHDRTNNIERASSTTGSGSTTESTAGYNSGDWANHTKEETSTTGSGSEDVSEGESLDESTHVTTRRTGNIGVTTTQQMIREEREIAGFNTIDYITQSFKKRFCVMVY